jgi:hypothetical protein
MGKNEQAALLKHSNDQGFSPIRNFHIVGDGCSRSFSGSGHHVTINVPFEFFGGKADFDTAKEQVRKLRNKFNEDFDKKGLARREGGALKLKHGTMASSLADSAVWRPPVPSVPKDCTEACHAPNDPCTIVDCSSINDGELCHGGVDIVDAHKDVLNTGGSTDSPPNCECNSGGSWCFWEEADGNFLCTD